MTDQQLAAIKKLDAALSACADARLVLAGVDDTLIAIDRADYDLICQDRSIAERTAVLNILAIFYHPFVDSAASS